MQPYKGVSKDQLRENLKYCLEAIMPVCDKWGIDMCIHPDDPPMPVFGMPRICCDAADIRWILDAVPNPHNGLTFCAGSLSSGAHNDVEAMAREFAPRTRFVHLRSCNLLPGGDFVEAPHTAGRVDLVELIRIFSDCPDSLPMRVDHGKTMLGDQAVGYNPGYGFHGRMLALGQVEGMMAAVKREKQLIK
jgi:mannonate dehydratase